jgi:hypothetical protein
MEKKKKGVIALYATIHHDHHPKGEVEKINKKLNAHLFDEELNEEKKETVKK